MLTINFSINFCWHIHKTFNKIKMFLMKLYLLIQGNNIYIYVYILFVKNAFESNI